MEIVSHRNNTGGQTVRELAKALALRPFTFAQDEGLAEPHDGNQDRPPAGPAKIDLLIGTDKLDGVNFVPAGNDVGGQGDFDAVGFERSSRELHKEVVEFGCGVVSRPD